MKSIFDPSIRAEIINRINTLQENSGAQWGKMTLYQMLKHCTLWEQMILGKTTYNQVFMGRLFGRIALKKVLKDEQPLGRNSPTIAALKITDDGDIAAQKKKWIALIEEEAHFSNPDFVHPFFGKMTKEQIGYMAYKHADHHLRQFNG
ncbi:DUF1569 domain-containing protein [Ferruginibacter paludis]|uniref:DUF1569 domain-containing protein n=1 Tax=Ferruginibacter paludis TaxID=1310417 RepID=UPI0025B3ED1A|nr:DUF1569 domain-containing protein [Ferruginibacter paludis]MDN3654253.1 DUF1569 domain-containing protein [Ferruginibacter paludis]